MAHLGSGHSLRSCPLSWSALLSLILFTSTACHTSEPPSPLNWETAFEPGSEGALLCAWGTGPENIWAVGGQPDAGIAWHFDGASWKRATMPTGPLLNWTHGAGDRQWIVGNQGRILSRVSTEEQWTTEDTPTEQPLWGVWAASAEEAWAVGGDPLARGSAAPIILHLKNNRWTLIEIPALDRQFRALFKVWGTDANNVYAIGAKGVILHYDGQSWTQEFAGTPRDLVSLWGSGRDDILVVGGRSNGVLLRFDGRSWSHKVLETEPGLNGVWMDQSGHATVVGLRGRIIKVAAQSYDHTVQDVENRTLLHGVWGTGEGHLIAVGGTLDRNPPWTGVSVEVR